MHEHTVKYDDRKCFGNWFIYGLNISYAIYSLTFKINILTYDKYSVILFPQDQSNNRKKSICKVIFLYSKAQKYLRFNNNIWVHIL